MLIRKLVALIFSFVLAVSAAQAKIAHAEEPIGFVMELRGDWVIEGKPAKPIQAGDDLQAGATIQPRIGKSKESSPRSGPVCRVCLYTGQVTRFDGRVTLPIREKASVVSRIWKAVQGRYHPKFVHAMSRGGTQDGVAKITDGTLDLSTVIRRAIASDYDLKFMRIDSEGSVDTKFKAIKIDAPPDWKGLRAIEVSSITVGLYALTLVDAGDAEMGPAAWVLVVADTGFEEKLESYNEAMKLTESWGNDVSAVPVKAFKRSYLLHLAANKEGRHGGRQD